MSRVRLRYDHRTLTPDSIRNDELHRLLFEKSPVGVFHYGLDLRIIECNSRLESILRSSRDRLIGLNLARLRDSRIIEAIRKPIEDQEGAYEGPYLATTSDARIWASLRTAPIHDPSGAIIGAVGIVEDITLRKVAEERLIHEALHDSLTGLPNRTLFLDRLQHSIERVKRGDYRFAVLFVDLDRFKVVNDSLGHMIGDELLRSVAHRVRTAIRPGDTIARLGGDEFAILVEDLEDVMDAIDLAARIQVEIAKPLEVRGHEIFSTASIGIATSHPDYCDPDEVLRDADAAMYRAKGAGRARHELFNAGMYRDALALFKTESDLRRAVDRSDFFIEYQPIVLVDSGDIAGFEALVRWRHPDRGIVMPGDFIGIAEETGLIVPLGQWVLSRACEEMAHWMTDLGFRDSYLSVNLSSRQFSQPDIEVRVSETIESSGLDPNNLTLEITESLLLEGSGYAREKLDRLRSSGVRLQIDDFGTGYSSLAYLHRFPIDALKIDRSFVANLETDPTNFEIVKTILALAENLAIDVIAEGIETDGQRRILSQLGCKLGQGDFFSRPLSAEDVETLIRGGACLRIA